MSADSAKRPCPICKGLLAHEADCLLVLAREARENVNKAVHALDDARKVETAVYLECLAHGANTYQIADVVGLTRPAVDLAVGKGKKAKAGVK